IAAFGLPLTEALPVDGATVQYFERARFESRDGTSVVLGRVVAEALLGRRAPMTPAVPKAGCQFFAETRHNLCEPLLQFWKSAGGVALLGYPLEEAGHASGMLVQHFERARLEMPEDKPVQLGRVGAEALKRMAGGTLLRASKPGPASQRAMVIGQTAAARPLGQATIRIRVEGYTGPAEIVVADRQGPTGRYAVAVRSGAAEARVAALGMLGPQAAIVLIGGRVAGVGASALVLRAETAIHTGQPRFDELLPMVKRFMDQDTSDYVFDGYRVHGYRSPDSDLLWLRDHVHQGKGYAYWERDMTSLLDQFRRFQYPDGSFDDFIAQRHWGVLRGRMEVEADLEYLFIEGVYRAWQATGDDEWLRAQVGAMERGLEYIRTSPLRWDAQHQLVKRPFTVDTWDFEYGPPTIRPDGKPAPRHWIDADTKWSIFHGDNTGYANSMELLARIHNHLGNAERAAYWRREATGIMERLNALAWNGSFFRHMVHLTPVTVPGVDEERQLSLSNAYALNRAGVDQGQAQAIIAEYHRRFEARGTAFSEWYSIDPPFPAGSLSTGPGYGQQPGEYVNGGHMPLVGGELARGAFRHGTEAYGFEILQRYHSLIAGTRSSYLWYYPEGQPGKSGPETLPTDGWGSSAMLAALIEGAAGVQDDAQRFERATIAPRWAAAGDVDAADVVVRYGASDGYVAYRWKRQADGIDLHWTGSGQQVQLRLLLPRDAPEMVRAMVDGQSISGQTTTVGTSRYLEASGSGSGTLAVRW
ncbi:MAG: hypothetical protein M3380_02540, partial [Chloroflexota bacterium]|nr:hypothetical protein [Chloroflexota bacterium]